MRVYLAAGVEGVEALRAGEVLVAPAFGVTSDLRQADPSADEEDLEYEAARGAEDYLRERGEVVVVIAAEVPAASEAPECGSAGRLTVEPVRPADVVSFHVAEHGAGPEEELLWYDATELDEVLRYLS